MVLTTRKYLAGLVLAGLLQSQNAAGISPRLNNLESRLDSKNFQVIEPIANQSSSYATRQESLEDALRIGTDAFFHPQTGAAEIKEVDGKQLMLVPWYASSSDKIFKKFDRVVNPSSSNYAMVSDEFSELAWLVSLGNNPQRMRAAYNTIEAMQGKYGTLPGWVAEVKDGRISLISQDSASDASARFIQTLLQASRNHHFPAEDRMKYRSRGIQMANDSHEFEYARGGFRSELTGKYMDRVGAGGGSTARGGVNGLNMYIGYYPDMIKANIAAYAATGDAKFWILAEDMIEQALIASGFNGRDFSVGKVDFGFEASSGFARPRVGHRGDYFWKSENPAWDEMDAPRFLGIGDVRRTLELSGRNSALLDSYMDAFSRRETHKFDKAALQYFANGEPFEPSRRGDYFAMGLDFGMHTFNPQTRRADTEGMEQKVQKLMEQFDFSKGVPHDSRYPGIYRASRIFKAAAWALGKDSDAYRIEPLVNSQSPYRLK